LWGLLGKPASARCVRGMQVLFTEWFCCQQESGDSSAEALGNSFFQAQAAIRGMIE